MPCLSSPGKNPCLSSREKKSGRGGPAARAAGRKSGTLPWRWGTRTAPTSAGRLKSSTASAPNSTKARARILPESRPKQKAGRPHLAERPPGFGMNDSPEMLLCVYWACLTTYRPAGKTAFTAAPSCWAATSAAFAGAPLMVSCSRSALGSTSAPSPSKGTAKV